MNSATAYIKTADDLFSRIVRFRGFCEHCGSLEKSLFQCAHIIGRDNKTLRWDANNALCLCDTCHRWAHAHPKLFIEWVESKFPDRYAWIMRRKEENALMKWYDYEDLIKFLREFLRTLESKQ
jgi:hypothetical protein